MPPDEPSGESSPHRVGILSARRHSLGVPDADGGPTSHRQPPINPACRYGGREECVTDRSAGVLPSHLPLYVHRDPHEATRRRPPKGIRRLMWPCALIGLAALAVGTVVRLHGGMHIDQWDRGEDGRVLSALVEETEWREVELPNCYPLANRTHGNYTLIPLDFIRESEEALRSYRGPPDFSYWLNYPPIRRQTVYMNVTSCEGLDIDLTVAVKVRELLRTPHGQLLPYVHDLKRVLKHLPRRYKERYMVVRLGDVAETVDVPVLTKARAVGDPNGIIMPFNRMRHFGDTFHELMKRPGGDPLNFTDKEAKLFWRGSSTALFGWNASIANSLNHRRSLMESWGSGGNPCIDVGFSHLVQDPLKLYSDHYERYVRPYQGLKAQLRYRYLLSVEGNDVASGLKWMLASNSVVLMAPPRRETWAMEGQLKAWVHYVPVASDFSDVWTRMLQCEAQPHICEAIAKRATEFVRWHVSKKRAYKVAAQRLKEYLDNVNVVPVFPNITTDMERWALVLSNASSLSSDKSAIGPCVPAFPPRE